MAIMVLIGVCCGIVMSVLIDRCTGAVAEPGEGLLIYWCFFITLFLSMILQTVIHEAGHLVFGLLSGYRFCSFRVFNLIWVKENGTIHLRRLSVVGTAGQCLMVPPEPVDGKIPVVLYNLGGSIMNAAVSIVLLLMFFVLESYPLLSGGMLIFSMMGFVLCLSNGIPMMTSSVPNDGYNAILLRRDPQALRAFAIQLNIVEQTARGVRLKDMPPEWFEIPSDEALKNGMVCAIAVFACNRLVDEQKLEEADRLMEQLLNTDTGMAGLHRNLLTCDRIYLEAIGQNRREVLDAMLTKEQISFQKQMKAYPSVLRTRYAYALLCEEDAGKAAKIRAKFEKAAKKYPYPCELEQEYEFMRLAEKRAQAS